MKLKDLSIEEIDSMSYSELTSLILSEKGSKMKIVDVFKKICEAKGMSEAEFENKVADYFELISTDKDFVVLDKGFCDLRIKHNQKVVVEQDDEVDEAVESEVENDSDTEVENENEEEDIFYDNTSDDDDVTDDDDDLADFVVVDEDEASM